MVFGLKTFLRIKDKTSFCASAIKYAEKTPFFEKIKAIAESMIENFELRSSKRTKYNITEQKVVAPSSDSVTTVGMKNINTKHSADTVSVEPDINIRPFEEKCNANIVSHMVTTPKYVNFQNLKNGILDLTKRLHADDAFAARLNSPIFWKIDNEAH